MNKQLSFFFYASFLLALFEVGCSKGSVVNLSDNSLVSKNPSSTDTTTSQQTSFRLMDRVQLTNSLYEITKPDNVTANLTSAAAMSYKNNFYARVTGLSSYSIASFGRPCIPNEFNTTTSAEKGDVTCGSNPQADNVIAPNTTSRESARVSICEALATYTTTVSNNGANLTLGVVANFKSRVASVAGVQASALVFVKNGSGFTVSAAQTAYLKTAYGLFFPGQTPSDDVLKGLVQVAEGSDSTASSSVDQAWENIFLTLCYSPTWQTI